MEIRTGDDIYLEGCDVREQSRKRNYNYFSTIKRTKQHKRKWVALDDVKKQVLWLKEGLETEDGFVFDYTDKGNFVNVGDTLKNLRDLIDLAFKEE